MTLSEKIKEQENEILNNIKAKQEMPFSVDEERYWTKYILDNIKYGELSIHIDYDVDMYCGKKINAYRVTQLCSWLKSEGLYYHFCYNSVLTIYTYDAIVEWQKSCEKAYNHTHNVYYNRNNEVNSFSFDTKENELKNWVKITA